MNALVKLEKISVNGGEIRAPIAHHRHVYKISYAL